MTDCEGLDDYKQSSSYHTRIKDRSVQGILASLATNPLVGLDVDSAAISRIARALPTTDIERLLEEIAPDDEDALVNGGGRRELVRRWMACDYLEQAAQ